MGNELNLEELAKLVEEVARERRLDVRVVGVTPTEGDGTYAEVVVAGQDDRVPLSIGLRRDAPVGELRDQIASNLSTRE
jgi:hypothetical protein